MDNIEQVWVLIPFDVGEQLIPTVFKNRNDALDMLYTEISDSSPDFDVEKYKQEERGRMTDSFEFKNVDYQLVPSRLN